MVARATRHLGGLDARHPLSIPRPHPTDTTRRCQRAGNPRDACRCFRCSRPLTAPAGRRTPPRLPARFQRAGGGAMPPLLNRSVGAPIPAEGGNLLAAPQAALRPSGLGAVCWAAAGRLAPRPLAWPPSGPPCALRWTSGHKNRRDSSSPGRGLQRAILSKGCCRNIQASVPRADAYLGVCGCRVSTPREMP